MVIGPDQAALEDGHREIFEALKQSQPDATQPSSTLPTGRLSQAGDAVLLAIAQMIHAMNRSSASAQPLPLVANKPSRTSIVERLLLATAQAWSCRRGGGERP